MLITLSDCDFKSAFEQKGSKGGGRAGQKNVFEETVILSGDKSLTVVAKIHNFTSPSWQSIPGIILGDLMLGVV